MIFLSASIPTPDKKKYFENADLFAIRDSVRALATVVIPKTKLVWGGHLAITPLIRYVITNFIQRNIQEHVLLYQTTFFEHLFPPDNAFFEEVRIVERKEDRETSLREMRIKMFTENQFTAGVFIGGMEGVQDEYEMFLDYQPHAKLFPVASTGAAARFIYESMEPKPNLRLSNDLAYMALFRMLFNNLL